MLSTATTMCVVTTLRTMVYDFDLMLEKKKEKARRNRKRRTNDIQLTAHDDVTISLTEKMKSAAEEDRKLNLAQKAATKKLSLLPLVSSSLKKLVSTVLF